MSLVFLSRLQVFHRHLLALEHHANEVVKLIVEVEDFFLEELKLAVSFDLHLVTLILPERVSEARRRPIEILLEHLKFFDCWDVVLLLVSIVDEFVAFGAGDVVLEGGFNGCSRIPIFLHLCASRGLFLFHDKPVRDDCNQE